jgi:hypothetical protein
LRASWFIEHTDELELPPAKDSGGTSDIPKNVTPELWRQRIGNVDCVGCHQLGQESTRTVPAQFGQFTSGAEAWARRIGSGQTGEFMVNRSAVERAGAPTKYFGDWIDRIAKGELPQHTRTAPLKASALPRMGCATWPTTQLLRSGACTSSAAPST